MAAASTQAAPAETHSRSWFPVPTPIRDLFKLFPLHVYADQPLPARSSLPTSISTSSSSTTSTLPTLYIFTDPSSTEQNHPSFNPSCLKAQTILRIARVPVRLVASSNHASPSGALPFLITKGGGVPLTGDKIRVYARNHAQGTGKEMLERELSGREEAYLSLIAQGIRPAYLHALYLLPENSSLLSKLYLPTSPLLRIPLLSTLQSAATSQILTTTRTSQISPSQLTSDLRAALQALSTLLGEDEWFFGGEAPGMFDAEVFAYTFLMLGARGRVVWGEGEGGRLGDVVRKFGNLARHADRMYEYCWETR